jgi:quinolinate synthase
MLWQSPLPPEYRRMKPDELASAIRARKARLGDDLIILGHHYQQDDVIQHADFTGDSFKLSQLAAQTIRDKHSRFVIFCGVHFMAESADILAPEGTAVILPDLSAGCSMADMAAYDDVVDAWEQIEQAHRNQATHAGAVRVIPITYMNSTAAIKAFVGEHGGAVCTSSNARKILTWAYAGGTKPRAAGERIVVLFLPDQYLGRNTAFDLGYDLERDMCVWDPQSPMPLGGNDPARLTDSSIILWKGHCSVHKLFRPEHVDQIRAHDPDMKVIVHPECVHEVVAKSDMIGSTEGIIDAIRQSPPGSRWAVGTEVHLVQRLADEARPRGVTVRILSDCQCLCTTMFRIDQPHLLWTLDELLAGRVVNQVKVDPTVKRWSLVALQRMLDITANPEAPVVVDQRPAVPA